jgi:hypothetical protein
VLTGIDVWSSVSAAIDGSPGQSDVIAWIDLTRRSIAVRHVGIGSAQASADWPGGPQP